MKRKTRRKLITFCLSCLLSCFSGVRADGLRPQAEELIERGEQLETQNDARGALKAFERGLDISRELGDETLVTRCLIAIAGIYITLAETSKGLSASEQALLAARRAGDRHLEAQALTEVGNSYFYLDKPLIALDHFEASLKIMREIGDRFGQANALKDIGITCRALGRYDEALETLNTALELFRETDAVREACSALASIGTCYDFVGAYSFAMDAYEQAIEIARKNDLVSLMLTTLTRMGYLCLNLNQPRRALDHFHEAEEIAARLGVPRERAWILMGMSGALAGLGQNDAAISANLQSLEIYRQINSASGIANNLRDLGHRYIDRDPALAADYYRRALVTSYNPLTWTPYHGLARVYRRQGKIESSIEHYEKAIERIEMIRGWMVAEQHRTTFAVQYQDVYQELMGLLVEQHERDPQAGYDRRAYAIFERIKARTMLEAISEARLDTPQEIEPDLVEREAQVNRRIAGLQKRLIEDGLAPDERRAVIEELNQSERDYDGLTVEIKRRSPRYALLRKPRSLSLEDAQSMLGDGSAIVAYMLSKESVLAFVITAGSLHVERLAAPPGFVTARVENLIDLISEDKAEGWRQASRSLYQDLFAPLIEHLPSQIKRLVIVPDGALHYLPFEILLQEGGEDRYLLEDYTISYAPSATVLAQLADPASTESTSERADLILFADPQLSPVLLAQNAPTGAGALTRALYEDEGLQVSPIPFSASEANVVSRYAGEGSAIYTGKEASERRVKSDRLDRFRIIHFATHGLVSQQRPSRSALVLASGEADGEDGFLQAREICNLRLASDLVVLSACQTAHGRVLAGEGIEGLARAFFYAGSKSVVASLWDVSDERTTRFMEVFYKYLASGRPKAEALRLAKLDLLKDSETSAPRYWAPFILVGEGDRIVAMSALPWWKQQIWLLIGGLAMLMLTLLAISVLRRRRPAQFLPVSDISSQ